MMLLGASLTIDGGAGRYGVDGNGHQGIVVGAEQSLTIQNIGSVLNSDGQIATLQDYIDGDYDVQASWTNFGTLTYDDATHGALYYNGDLTINDTVFSNIDNSGYNIIEKGTGTIKGISNTTFINNTANSIIYQNAGNIGDLSNVNFVGNTTTSSDGMVYLPYVNVSSIDANFIGNTTSSNLLSLYRNRVDSITGTYTGNTITGYGISSDLSYYIGEINADFIDNNGQAIYLKNTPVKSINTIIRNNTKGIAVTNLAVVSEITGTIENIHHGGNIYNQGTALSLGTSAIASNVDVDFIGNSVNNNTNPSYLYTSGAAVNNSGGSQVTLRDSQFTRNIARSGGGAIYNAATINLIADTQDSVFTDNYIGNFTVNNYTGEWSADGDLTRNDIYNIGTINLNANSSEEDGQRMIIFNGGIAGNGDGVINLNKSGLTYTTLDENYNQVSSAIDELGGLYVFNSAIDNNNINLYNDAHLKLGSYEQSDGTTTYGSLNVNTLSNDANGGVIDTQNGRLDTGEYENKISGLSLNSSIKLAIDVSLQDALADTIDVGTITGSGSVVINAINLMNLSGSDRVNITLTTNENLISRYALSNDIFNNITGFVNPYDYIELRRGVLSFYNETSGNTTLDRIYKASKNYLNTTHDVIELDTTAGDGKVAVIINGTTYYYTPDTSTEEKKAESEKIVNLIHTGYSAMYETTSQSEAVFKAGNKYYSYEPDKLPQSVWAMEEGSSTDYNFKSYTYNDGVLTPEFYQIRLKPLRMRTLNNINWSLDDSATAKKAFTYDSSTGFGTGTIAVTYPHNGNSLGTSDTETKYYTYIYKNNYADKAPHAQITSLSGNLDGEWFNSGAPAVKNTSSSGYNITADFLRISGNSAGLAIYNSGKLNEIKGSFIGNKNSAEAIIANREGGVINSIVGDFISNKAKWGSAINVKGSSSSKIATIHSIVGNFLDNENTSGGGTISLSAWSKIDSITGNFIGNTSSSEAGAISSKGIIGAIAGDFVGNVARNGDGGAIKNIATNGSYNTVSIDSITGDFIANKASADKMSGGAISNNASYSSNYTALINSITGDFIGNYAKADGGAINNSAESGATARINSITGNFTENVAGVSGGAIRNYTSSAASTAIIDSIKGSFVANRTNSTNGNGGAIYNGGYAKAIINSIDADFIGNISNRAGGAIYSGSGSIGTINGNFIGNTAANEGGAISLVGTAITSISGNFENNIGNQTGGAIYINKNGQALSAIQSINANFKNNTSTTGSGGAIYSNLVINNITGDFEGNTAKNYGGAIDVDTGGSVINSIEGNFTNNTATNYSGGAISLIGTGVTSVSGSFEGNSAIGGGAININRNGYTLSAVESIEADFSNNTATNGSGGAIYSNILIKNITGDFAGNTAKNYGGAIRMETGGGVADSISGNFTNNTATNYSGGAISLNGTGVNTISGSFEGNSAIGGGAINIDRNGYTLSAVESIEADFSNNTATNGSGGAIYSNVLIKNITGDFEGNTASGYGGAVHIETNGSVIDSISGNYTNNTATNYSGGALSLYGTGVTSVSGSFEGNSAVSGGAIYINRNGKTLPAVESIEADFTNNTATNGSGGAINTNIQISNIKGDFVGNTASGSGGAIYTSSQIGNIKGDFDGNTASVGGGAVFIDYTSGTTASIEGNFINNTAMTGDAALVIRGSNVGTIKGNFSGNRAGANGGALTIYNPNGGAVRTVSKIIGDFTNNIANGQGGAFNSNYVIGQITGSFKNNIAGKEGGAMYIYKDITVLSEDNPLEFSGNISGTGYGGAIYNNGTLNIVAQGSDINFFNNKSNVTLETDEDGFKSVPDLTTGRYSDIDNVNNSTINLNAAEGKKISFGGIVTGSGYININSGEENTGVRQIESE